MAKSPQCPIKLAIEILIATQAALFFPFIFTKRTIVNFLKATKFTVAPLQIL
jgi:hypothetical protein